MKQYLDQDQTAKLIELGFMSKAKIKEVQVVYPRVEVAHDCNFTIGELIEILPEVLAPSNNDDWEMPLSISTDSFMWTVKYDGDEFIPYEAASIELIDALYDMIIKLKEEKII